MLNKQQRYILDSILNSEANQKYSLQGEAGTGKTFLICKLAEAFVNKDEDVLCLAPTHEAKNVLRANFDESILASGKIDFQTVAKASGAIALQNDFKELNFIDKSAFETSAKLIIVDEMSMVSLRHSDALMKLDKIVVFVGDKAQLRVVKAKANAITESEDCIHFRLTEQMRASTDIEEIAKRARDFELAYYPKSKIKTRKELIEKFLQSDLENSAYLTYTNKLADEISLMARTHLYGTDSEAFVIGETLLSRFNGNSIKNNERFKILSVTKEADDDFILEVAPGEFIKTKSPSNMAEYKKELDRMKSRAMKLKEAGNIEAYNQIINEHFDKLNSYAEVVYPYSYTIHKSQGKTIQNVFVDTLDIMRKGSDRRRLLYVAYSRASENLFTIANDEPDKKFIFRYLVKKLKEQLSCKIPLKRFNDTFLPDMVEGHLNFWCNTNVRNMLTLEQNIMLDELA